MVRVLQSVNIMDRAGLETMLMNYYRHIDRKVIQFDFLTHREWDGAYDDEIRSLGGNVYHAPRLFGHYFFKYFQYMNSFFNEHPEYRIIHSHIDAMSFFPLMAAKQNDIPVRIAHSHSSKLELDLKFPIKFFGLRALPNVTTEQCACGRMAGEFMFPKGNFKIIRNAIELKKFQFNQNTRADMRKKLRLDNKFVVGHIGRYCQIKNQLFLLDIFAEIKKVKSESVLLLVGKGPDEQVIRNKIKKLGLASSVMLLLDRSDVDRLYQTFDVFVLPSLFEGVPVVGIEAQANGLQCIVSDRISKEVLLTSSIQMLSIKAIAKEWAQRIVSCNLERNENAVKELREAGYDIEVEAKKFQEWYLELQEAYCQRKEN